MNGSLRYVLKRECRLLQIRKSPVYIPTLKHETIKAYIPREEMYVSYAQVAWAQKNICPFPAKLV